MKTYSQQKKCYTFSEHDPAAATAIAATAAASASATASASASAAESASASAAKRATATASAVLDLGKICVSDFHCIICFEL